MLAIFLSKTLKYLRHRGFIFLCVTTWSTLDLTFFLLLLQRRIPLACVSNILIFFNGKDKYVLFWFGLVWEITTDAVASDLIP